MKRSRVVDCYEEQFLFVTMGEKATCLVCMQSVLCKKFNIERHYKSFHANTFDKMEAEEKKNNIKTLKENFNKKRPLTSATADKIIL